MSNTSKMDRSTENRNPYWVNYARDYIEQNTLFGTNISEMTIIVTPTASPAPRYHPNPPMLRNLVRLERITDSDMEDIDWDITTESINQPSNNTLPLHDPQNRNTWNHGFQNTGSKSFSTEDFFLGIKTGLHELPGGQPKTSTPSRASTRVYDTRSPPTHNPMTSTPQETLTKPHQDFDTTGSSELDLTYLNRQDLSEVTTLRERKQPNKTKERNPIEQARWQVKNQTEADLTNVIYDYKSLIKEITEHNNYQTINFDEVSYGLKGME